MTPKASHGVIRRHGRVTQARPPLGGMAAVFSPLFATAMSRSPRLSRRHLLATAPGALALGLSACGGGSDSAGKAQIRVLNLSSDVASLDIDLDAATWVSGAATAQLTAYKEVDPDSYDFSLRRSGSTIALASGERTLSKDAHYTLVVWGRETALTFVTLTEDEDPDDVDSGKARIRVYNASADSGSLDLYLTATAVDLQDTTAAQSAVGAGLLSGYRDMSAGSYRLRVTGYGDASDLRLDVDAIALSAKSFTTVILTGTSSGVLVNGYALSQQGSVTPMATGKARVRVVASADNRGAVGVTWAGQALAAALSSPTVGPYTSVDAGTQTLNVLINGQLVSSGQRSLSVGVDYSLMVWGSGAVSLIADDNRLPTNSARVKLRLIHGSAGTDPLTMAVDYSVTAAGVAQGTASGFSTLNASSSVRLDVSTSADQVYTDDDVTLSAQGVYTAFVLGGRTTPTGLLRKDR